MFAFPSRSEVGEANRVDGITKDDYERVRPKIEAVAAAARTTTNSIYIIDYYKRNFHCAHRVFP